MNYSRSIKISLRLVDTSILVVDEFDRLFGGSDFEDQVSHVLAAVAKNKVCYFTKSSCSPILLTLCTQFLKCPLPSFR